MTELVVALAAYGVTILMTVWCISMIEKRRDRD